MPGPIATVGSMHVCPMCTGYIPHVGGPITMGEANILVNGKPIATIGSMCTCIGPPDTVAQGFPNILVNGKPVACMGDLTAHGGKITVGEPNVIAGSATPTPSVNMPVNKIPFPNISFTDRIGAAITGNSGSLREAQENQDKLKNQDEGEPKIYNVQWLKEKKNVRDSKVLKQVIIRAYVLNIPDGETLTFDVRRPTESTDETGTVTTSEDDVIQLTGTVENKKVEVTWEIEDLESQEQNNTES